MVNLPANQLNPKTYSAMIERIFAKEPTITVDVWDDQRLHAEQMNLLLTVGAGSKESSRLVHIKYRPKQKSNWAHLDIYGWVDKPTGCYREVGANGQAVQLLIGLLKALIK